MKDAPSSPFFLSSLLTAAMGFALFAPSAMAGDQTCLVEAEAFQFPFNWIVNKDSTCSNGAMLSTTSTEDDALTVIDLPAAGRYTLWARGRDFATDQQGSRRFRLVVDGVPSEKEGGMHGRDGWYWEKLGTQELAQGRHILGLRDSSHLFPRCDAFLLTTGGFDPNTLPEGALDQYRITPVKARMSTPSFPLKSPELKATSRREVGHIGNDLVRLRFVEARDVNGQPVIVRETEVFSGRKWEKAPVKEGGETLSMLYSTASKFSMGGVFPVWNGSKATFQIEGKVGGIIRKNPFGAGERELLVPRSAQMKDEGTAEVVYEAVSGQKVVTQWTASPQRHDIAVTATFTAAKEGEYSLVFSPFQPWEKEQIEFNLLPPIFNYQRAPEAPFMQMSAMTPQALALVQATPQGSKERFSFAVVADPARLTFDWPDATNSAYGFSLLNGGGQVQPTLFTPILGLADSKLKAGEAKTVSWLLLVEPGDWKTALEDASSHIFNVTDYRHPYGASLTDAALNMVDLMKDDRHSGWDATLKGFYNIESKGTVSQVSPLMMLSTALLTQDEDFYVKRALPSFEYTLSRPGAHFATVLPPTAPNYVSKETMKIHIPSEFFGTAYWQGVDDLFGRKNPWIAQYAFKDGKLRTPTSYASTPRWSEMLGAYRLDPKPELLAEIQKEATRFVQTEIYGRKTADIGTEPFINRSYYPYWWDLVDLYELTHDKQYLDAAEECAFHTVSDLWSQPSTPQGNHTINPSGQLPYTAYHWYWTGYERLRLGWPLSPEATREKQVPAWVLSRVGLGVEQYSTYCQPVSGPYRNIMMSAWSPNLLRVYQYTGREIFQTYARNSIIGRFGNYPGYYIQTYADAQLSPRYPLEGPDITDIYYHHIPAHLAFTVDFLVSEAAVRSKGQIAFPWVKQQGYVWFTNRIYGHAPGKVYGDEGVSLYLNRDAVKVDSDQISTLAARGAGRFDLILMNEADTDLVPSIALDEKSLGIAAGQPYRVIINGTAKEQHGPVSGAVTVPAKGIAVISLPTLRQNAAREIPVLQTAPVEQKLGGDWGSLHAFRIRSPFGKDSLYAVLTGGKPGSKVRLVIEGESNSPREVSAYPYEFSVYPIPMDKDLTFHLELKDAAGVETQSEPVTLQGTR